MQIAHHFFENGMAFFTEMIQIGISMTVAAGSVSPFVGHNAFMRWSALQECAFVDPYDDDTRVWSEEHVSEDFQIALNLQARGWIIRWATYANCGFQEGVSLTCVDELSRWQKYAWGCSEIIFHPIKYWPKRGPFTKLFRAFLGSKMTPHSKFAILAYIFSYYAFSSAWCASVVSYVLIGVFAWTDTFYLTAWNVFLVCLILFQGLSSISICILRYRLKLEDNGRFAGRLLAFIPFFTVFFSGLSLSIAASLVSHLLGINMSWTATSKSVERSNFFLQLPKIFRRFWGQLLISIAVLASLSPVHQLKLAGRHHRQYDPDHTGTLPGQGHYCDRTSCPHFRWSSRLAFRPRPILDDFYLLGHTHENRMALVMQRIRGSVLI